MKRLLSIICIIVSAFVLMAGCRTKGEYKEMISELNYFYM